MRGVEKISCTNNGGFVMNFAVRWLDHNGEWHTSHWNSGNYPINQTRSCDLVEDAKVPKDALAVTPYVHAILGKHEQGTTMVKCAENDQTASYEVKGTTLSFSVNLL